MKRSYRFSLELLGRFEKTLFLISRDYSNETGCRILNSTRSVSIAGVLVVFSYLIIPAACAIMFVDNFFRSRLMAWGIALGVSFSGLAFSAWKDLPTGPSLVATFGAVLMLCIAVQPLTAQRRSSDS